MDFANEFIVSMGLGDPTAYVYKFTSDKKDIGNTHII